ncbi:undecaprenyl-diphosphate phosphatase [Bacillaceae bacterium SIJ1]|uniref:undecaprenyl-diphosphate phosphatase n=1 Tax=Litoribacterium kuwaitense TaxID=1398745 RepID=UPI0013EE0B65|nr:undecaprenyl-diphosphate phosphatase [Litoribacterium kuwaitense]NGP44643.1 undecaprenyl-diphosphate phosphatase [Litoribacterium kuwaitense]
MEELWLVIKYVLLGLFQGFTEPIPISSSGHLVMLQNLIQLTNEGLDLLILLNFGSFIAVVIIYWHDIIRLAKNAVSYVATRDKAQRDDFDMVLYLIVATIPAGVIGVVFGDFIDERLDQAWLVGATLIVTGIALWIIRNLRGRRNEGQLTWKDAIIVGLAQAVALIPGISRSGATIVAAMLLGMKRDLSLRFSFLLYIPVSLGSMILSIDTLMEKDWSSIWLSYSLAFIAATIASYFSLRWFMGIMERGNLKYFAYYCFAVGFLAILFLR